MSLRPLARTALSFARTSGICRHVQPTFAQPGIARSLLLQERVEGLIKAVERQRDAHVMAAGVGKRKFSGAGSSAEFFQHIVLDVKVREAAIRRTARERAAMPASVSPVWIFTLVPKLMLTGTCTTSLTG